MLSGVNGKRVVVPLSVLTLVSMISSYFREIFIAAKFGTGFQADAYLSVATIVRFICDVGPCAVLLACVVPVVASLLEQPQSVRRHLVGVLTLISLGGTVLLALALYIAMPWLLSVAAPGFGVSARQASQELAVGLVWFLPLQTTSFLFSLILNAHGRFWLVAALSR